MSVQVNVRATPEISVGSRGCPAGPPVLADDRSLRRQGGDGFRLSSNQPDSGSTSERALQRPSPPRGIRDNADLWDKGQCRPLEVGSRVPPCAYTSRTSARDLLLIKVFAAVIKDGFQLRSFWSRKGPKPLQVSMRDRKGHRDTGRAMGRWRAVMWPRATEQQGWPAAARSQKGRGRVRPPSEPPGGTSPPTP